MTDPCAPLALTTAVNTLATAMARCLDDSELALAAAILTQLGDTLATIAVGSVKSYAQISLQAPAE